MNTLQKQMKLARDILAGNMNKGDIADLYLKIYPKREIDYALPDTFIKQIVAMRMNPREFYWLYSRDDLAGRPISIFEMASEVVKYNKGDKHGNC